MAATEAYELREVLLHAEKIYLRFGDNLVLRDVDLKVQNIVRPTRTATGQVIGLLGPSGMGKTQLFRILAGLNQPDTGTVLIGPKQVPVTPGMVGVVAQHYPLFRHRTVLGNLIVAGVQAGMSRREARDKTFELLKRFGLEERAKYYPAQLSGGQRQRVAIAQQFMCSEHFLFMDEPFSGLDPIALKKVYKLVDDVANMDDLNTTIVITHDIEAAVEVADTLWLLGRDRDEAGNAIPGARIQRKYDLIERGLAWRPDVSGESAFFDVVREGNADFALLSDVQ